MPAICLRRMFSGTAGTASPPEATAYPCSTRRVRAATISSRRPPSISSTLSGSREPIRPFSTVMASSAGTSSRARSMAATTRNARSLPLTCRITAATARNAGLGQAARQQAARMAASG